MHIPFAVFISLALALPTLAAPVAQRKVELQDLAARNANEPTIPTFAASEPITGDEDELALKVRKVAAKKPAVKAKPIAKPKPVPVAAPKPVAPIAKPKPVPVAAPKPVAPIAKPKPAPVVAPKPVAPIAKPKPAPVAVKPPTKPAPAPVKPPVVVKPPTKPAAPPVKPPVVVKPPTKPAAPPVKPPVVVKPPTKPPVKAPTKATQPVVKPPAKKPTVSSARPSPSASKAASCALPAKAKKPATTKVRGRAVASTQFHATCKSFAPSIESAMKAGTFALQPERIFPNEFTWSGGFYITPDEDKAQLFGATFLADKCASLGGVVVMKLSFDTSGLKVKEVGSGSIVDKFRSSQSKLGNTLIRFLKKQQPSDATPADPPTDDGIGKDDNPAVSKPAIAIPTPEEAQAILNNPAARATPDNKKAFADLDGVDVVAGAGSLTASQKVTIEDAGNPEVGIPPLTTPFNQVVLVSDKAMKQLKLVSQEALPECLAEAQPKLVAFLKKKGAAQ